MDQDPAKLYETPIDEKKDQEEYEFIIESGFSEFILLNRLLIESSNSGEFENKYK